MGTEPVNLRKQIGQAFKALTTTLHKLQRSMPMLQGSFYLLRRKCGKPNCRCTRGKLHATWVLTRSEKGKDRIYSVPKKQQANVQKWAGEYRRYQRARAALVKRHLELLRLVDRMAEQRLVVWPEQKKDVANA